MMVFNIKNTEIYVCESTAKALIKCPDVDVLDSIADFVVDNNYVCHAVYSKDNAAVALTKKIGGTATNNMSVFERQLEHIQ